MTHISRRHRIAVLAAAHLMYLAALAAPFPSLAMQILEAADHAELAAEISATGVNRIALHGDRIARVVRAPDGFAVEHDPRSGDLYLRPATLRQTDAPAADDPVTLFVGTEKGFTYRLTLTPSERDSAQILIRNARALPEAMGAVAAAAGDAHVAALVRLVRAVARREPLAGYEILAGGDPASRAPAPGLALIETWRGPRFAALVLEAARPASSGADGAAGLAGTIGTLPGIGRIADGARPAGGVRLAALWLAAPGTGPSGGSLAVAVLETLPAGEPR